jgi:hypothetical protein
MLLVKVFDGGFCSTHNNVLEDECFKPNFMYIKSLLCIVSNTINNVLIQFL